ncbi:MAG TPA: hypothetical protein VI122_17135 [Thermoleophilaceae bacterium]
MEETTSTAKLPPSSSTGGLTSVTPGSRSASRATLSAWGPSAADRELDRGVSEGWKLGPQRVVDPVRAGAVGQDLGVDRGEPDAEEGDPERDQQRRACDRDPAGEPHHQPREPVPEALLGGPGVAFRAAAEEGGRKSIDARSEQGQDRRQHDQRHRRGDQRDQRPADAHRVQEALGEDEQRRERAGHGQRAEQNRAPRCCHRAPHGLESGARLGDLLAVARDDEQAVVDRQPEPESDHEVEREDRDRAKLAGHAQHQRGADDRQPPDHQR